MADEERMTKEQLGRALGAVVRRPCPICGGTEWHSGIGYVVALPVEARGEDATEEVGIELDIDVTRTMPALPMICGECGFIAQFAYKTLLELAEDSEQH